MARASARLFPLDFESGEVLSGKYRVEEKLGEGWEGEVYKVTELGTGVRRVAKFWHPHRDPRGRVARRYARKVEALADCPVVTRYSHRDWLELADEEDRPVRVPYLVSEYARGEVLARALEACPGGRLPAFEALHLLRALAGGVAEIHGAGWYHGDIHSENILVRRTGIDFQVKLLDFFDLGRPSRARQQDDVVDLAHLLYEMIGGSRHYRNQPPLVKHVCAGKRRDLILRRMPNIGRLLYDLAEHPWEE